MTKKKAAVKDEAAYVKGLLRDLLKVLESHCFAPDHYKLVDACKEAVKK
jgi:hypothetical protein